jgi:hypothetical protein
MSEWEDNCKELESELLLKGYDNFLRFSVISRNMVHRIHQKAFEELKTNGYLSKWKEALKENSFGNPVLDDRYLESSGNLLHHAFSLSQLYEKLGNIFDITKLNSIYEFGGGYGSFTRLCYNLGFTGSYTIYDFPVFLILQEIYLKNIGFKDENIIYSALPPNTKQDIDLFIALWSISESPLEVRKNILDKINPKYILITYQIGYGGVNNKEFFTEMAKTYTNYRWESWEMKHIPLSYYLIGVRNE